MERWREGGRECQAAVSWSSLSDCWGSPEVQPKAKGKRACFHEAVCEVLSTSGSGSGSRQWGAAPCWGAQGPVLHWCLAHRVWGALEDEAYIGVSMGPLAVTARDHDKGLAQKYIGIRVLLHLQNTMLGTSQENGRRQGRIRCRLGARKSPVVTCTRPPPIHSQGVWAGE